MQRLSIVRRPLLGVKHKPLMEELLSKDHQHTKVEIITKTLQMRSRSSKCKKWEVKRQETEEMVDYHVIPL